MVSTNLRVAFYIIYNRQFLMSLWYEYFICRNYIFIALFFLSTNFIHFFAKKGIHRALPIIILLGAILQSHHLSDIISDTRQRNQRPCWVRKDYQEELIKYQDSNEFKWKSRQAKTTRNSDKGGSLHTCGSVSIGSQEKIDLKILALIFSNIT